MPVIPYIALPHANDKLPNDRPRLYEKHSVGMESLRTLAPRTCLSRRGCFPTRIAVSLSPTSRPGKRLIVCLGDLGISTTLGLVDTLYDRIKGWALTVVVTDEGDTHCKPI
jgi:hypothetical protein